MFYYLFFAHLLGDYPLQPNWLVAKKTSWVFLVIHTSIHFLTSAIILWISYSKIGLLTWPYLLLLAVIHFLIDTVKNKLSKIHPTWIKIPYVADQLVHLLSIGIVALLIQNQFGIIAFPTNPGWALFAIAYLLVTYVWFISERVMTYDEPSYRKSVINYSWSRMVFRAFFLTGILGFWIWAGKSLALSVGSLYIPYQSNPFGRRALLTDIAVTVGVFVLIIVVPYSISFRGLP